jgi:hypothetical protein
MHKNKSNWVKSAGLFSYSKGFDEQGSKTLTLSFTSSYKQDRNFEIYRPISILLATDSIQQATGRDVYQHLSSVIVKGPEY